MPSPPKDRPSGRLGRFLAALRPSRAGPLPVQTGFPTSLADLVVKNHGRLKKQPSPSSKRGKRGAAPPPSSSASPSPPPASPPTVPTAAEVSPSDRPRPDLSAPPAVRRGKGGAFGLGFLAVSGVVSLALLVIWSKKVVAAVTVASFSLFLFESVRSSGRPRPAATKRQPYLEGRGRVSPIREVEAETEPSRPSCSDIDRCSEVTVSAIEERSDVVEGALNRKAKTKVVSWKKLIAGAKKLHRGRKCKEPEAGSSGSFRRGERDDGDATVRGNASATDSSDSRRGKAGQADAAEDAIAEEPDPSGSRRGVAGEPDPSGSLRGRDTEVGIDAPVDIVEEGEVEEEERKAEIQCPALVLVAVVLVGLVAGKLPAMALTVICAAFLGTGQRLRRFHDGGERRFPCRRKPSIVN